MNEQISKTLFSEQMIRDKVAQLGAQLAHDYKGKDPIFIGVLKGCFIFMADLIRQVNIPLSVDFMVVSSYGDQTTSTGVVKIIKDLSCSIEGRHVVIVEDILDTGFTLSYLKSILECRNPASIRIVTLLDKDSRRKADIEADYIGFSCPDAFIIGYGLDKAEHWRNLPYIAVLGNRI